MHRQSKVCRACYLSERRKPENYVTKPCPVCGKDFTVHVLFINKGQGKYCSHSCARSGSPTRKKTAPLVICFTCGKEFIKYRSNLTKNIGDKSFCSRECWYNYNQLENHYLYAGGQNERMNPESAKWHRSVMIRDKCYCRICHVRRNLEVHHIKPFTAYPETRWDVSNGITLCRDCHVRFRNKEADYIEILSFIASVPIKEWRVNP
jgi:hypothetical protein